MKTLPVILLLLALLAPAYMFSQIVISDDLKANCTTMPVKGKQGLQLGQVIRFGGYTTSKVIRSWPGGFAIDFVVSFNKAKEKLSFKQYTPDSLSCSVLAVGRFNNTDIGIIKNFMGYSLKFENTFIGTIIPEKDKENIWEFVVVNPDVILDANAGSGSAKDRKGTEIVIKGITRMAGEPSWAPAVVHGYGFSQDGREIGAVSITGNGKVYLRNDLPPETRMILAALSSALMVRRNMSEVNQ